MANISKKFKILVVEDEENLRTLLVDFLELSGFKVVASADGVQALEQINKSSFDVFLFDVMMPAMDGFSLAMQVRKQNIETPIIFLTAKEQYEDKIKGFKIGCDDYITKPFGTEELKLRIDAIIKRCSKDNLPNKKSSNLTIGKYNLDFNNQTLIFDKAFTQKLTEKEAFLLHQFFSHPNQLLTRESLLKSIWGDDDYFIGRSMDVFIARLRKYLQKDPNISIKNFHGKGFMLEYKIS